MRRTLARIITGAAFILAGLNHFWNPRAYRAIMPPYLPWHGPLVALSGLAEVVLGGLVLVPRLAPAAGHGLVALLIAVFPANLHMALHSAQFRRIPRWLLWARLPAQGLLIALVRWATRRG